MLRVYKRLNPRSIENNHYQDSTIISLYLSGMYPGRYALYPGRELFNDAMKALHARENRDNDDLLRFFKVSQTLYNFLLKDDTIRSMLESGLRPAANLMLAHEFLYHLAGKWEMHVL
jgi:hypothetical protein